MVLHARGVGIKKEWDLVGDPTLERHSEMADKFANLFRRSTPPLISNTCASVVKSPELNTTPREPITFSPNRQRQIEIN